jgi:hypothetical protein
MMAEQVFVDLWRAMKPDDSVFNPIGEACMTAAIRVWEAKHRARVRNFLVFSTEESKTVFRIEFTEVAYELAV